MDERSYREEILRTGVGFEARDGVLQQLCRRLIRSRELGPGGDDVNLVAVVRPDVVEAVRIGSFVDESGRSLLVLPPDPGLFDAVRDALWIEAGLPQVEKQKHERRPSRRTWAKHMAGLMKGLSWAARRSGFRLGPRSTICHQDKIVATTTPGAVYGPDGSLARHEHDAWVRLRVPIPADLGFPDPSFYGVDLCWVCGASTGARVLLGVATLPECTPHRHVWTPFAAPVPDARGALGAVAGEVCLESCPEGRNSLPGRCLETRSVQYRTARRAVASVLPGWVRTDRPLLRPLLETTKKHKHLWAEGLIELGLGANLRIVECVTCGARLFSNRIRGETIPEVAKEIRRRVKPYGGFSRVPDNVLEELRQELRPEWGEWLQRFTDAVSMIVCQSGGTLREASAAELERAAAIVRRAKDKEAAA